MVWISKIIKNIDIQRGKTGGEKYFNAHDQ